ncbi:MAG: hypothetical protein WDO15_15710 [Bacteroidota bacterium]
MVSNGKIIGAIGVSGVKGI